MLSFLTKILPEQLSNRLFNKYTGHGSWLLLFVMAEQGVLPLEAVKMLDGMPNLHVWVFIALALYLILKAPKAYQETKKSNKQYVLQLKQIRLESKKIDLELLKLKNEEKEIKDRNKEVK